MEIYKCERYIYDAETDDIIYDETTGEPVTVPNDNFDAMEIDGEAVELDCDPSLELDTDHTVRLRIGSDKVIKDFSFGNWEDSPNDRLRSVIIPDGVTAIGVSAFGGCTNLSSITIPDSVTSIGGYAFGRTSLSSVTIPDSVTSIGDGAFDSCTSLSSVTIPDSVTAIGVGAFQECTSLSSITIGSGVTSIVAGAFQECTSLSSVTIPDSVTYIDYSAFDNCASLSNITYNGTVEQWKQINGYEDILIPIHCSDGDYRHRLPE